jgi:competence protein ComGC
MRHTFTLLELIIVVMVAGILVSLAVPTYHILMENSRTRVCAANQKVLLRAVEAFALEQDVLPGNLSHLETEHLKRALAEVMQEEGAWKIKLAYCFIHLKEGSLAYAQTTDWVDRYVEDLQTLRCPLRPTGTSYGLNSDLNGISRSDYETTVPDNLLVIADSDNTTFAGAGGLASRHSQARFGASPLTYAVGVCRKGDAVKAYYNTEVENMDNSHDSISWGDLFDY